MRVVRFTDFAELAPYASDWDRLAAGNPFRSWAWASAWWRHYGVDASRGGPRRPYVLVLLDPSGRPAGIGPWYVEWSPIWGRVLRFLGSGEACAEYLGVLAEPGGEEGVAVALAAWLAEAEAGEDRWDLAEWTSGDSEDLATGLLVDALRSRGLETHSRSGPSCWRLELPPTWEQYLATLSSRHRKTIHQAENQWINSGRVEVHVVRTPGELPRAQDILIDLHQRRHESLGGRGAFASARFTAFHRAVMARMLLTGQLLLSWIEIDGKPVAAEYSLSGGGVVYFYQAGWAPESSRIAPGNLARIVGLRHAIAEGCRAFDFLRGDEPYKARWGATARTTCEFRVAAPRASAKGRLRLWLAGSLAKQRIKDILHPVPQP
jgi:CelD/BcsL family acetyltransferase involved in cellulose biosynthesis